MTDEQHSTPSGHWPNASRYAFVGFAAVAGFFLFTEHRAHLFGILPYLLLAACPLMHLFHHSGHRDHDKRDASVPQSTSESTDRDVKGPVSDDRPHQH
jgi:hypothetical protein